MRRFRAITKLCFVLLLLLSHAQAQEEDGARAVRAPALRQELLRRVAQDQSLRNELISKGVTHPDKDILARMQASDRANAERVREIVRQYGWPGPELVGRDGAEAAFLLVQHADHAVQKEMLPLVERAYRRGGLSGQSYALLLDRVLVGEGQPQLYGTQAKGIDEWPGGEPVLQPISDEAQVDQRRAAVGLPPLAVYRELLKQMYFPHRQRATPP